MGLWTLGAGAVELVQFVDRPRARIRPERVPEKTQRRGTSLWLGRAAAGPVAPGCRVSPRFAGTAGCRETPVSRSGNPLGGHRKNTKMGQAARAGGGGFTLYSI